MLLVAAAWICYYMVKMANSDAGINFLNEGCSNYNVSSVLDFSINLNNSFSDLRSQINGGKHFATTQRFRGADSVYAMIQCRDYMSTAECLSCFSVASTKIRNCSAANGGRVIYDGCFLRYFKLYINEWIVLCCSARIRVFVEAVGYARQNHMIQRLLRFAFNTKSF